MRNLITNICLTLFILFLSQEAQTQAPNLGSSANFAVFTAVGAFSNDGATVVTGDIGTDVGAFTGFPPGVVFGQIHVADAISAQAAIDVDVAYGYLSTVTCGLVIGTTLGGGQILTPNVYCTGAASTLNGDLILDADCDPNGLFIIKIDGAFSSTVLSRVILRNSASLCNVYWQINGAVELGASSIFRGNILANGAISLLDGASLYGRALSREGAIDLHNNIVNFNMLPAAQIIVADGPIVFCEGDSVVLSGNCGGVWNDGSTGATLTVTQGSDYFVTSTNACGSVTSNHILVVVNAAPICTITGNTVICQGQSTQLCAAAGATNYIWNTGEVTSCIVVTENGVYTVTVSDQIGCSSVCSISVIVSPLPNCTITGLDSICQGQTTQLCAPAGLSTYLWSTGETTQCINVSIAGLYSITVTDEIGCSNICSVLVTVSPLPNCSITGSNIICEGQLAVLCTTPGAASYLWSNGNTTNCITVGIAGIYTVTVTELSGCSSTCSIELIVNPSPICTITGGGSICLGQSSQLCGITGMTSYLWSTGETTECILITTGGTYSLTVTNMNGCSSVCSTIVDANSAPVCAITGNSSQCFGQTVNLCAIPGMTQYFWSTGESTECISVNTTGAYYVTVTDAVGCTSVCSEKVVFTAGPNCLINGSNFICDGQSTMLCALQGVANARYLWNTGETTNCIIVSEGGTYSLTVTSANGCTSVCSKVVDLILLPECTIIGEDGMCHGETLQWCAPFEVGNTYIWNTGAITNCIEVRETGTYTVTVTRNGCSSVCSKILLVKDNPVCVITGSDIICKGSTTTFCAPDVSGNTYVWTDPSNATRTTRCITVSNPGTYFLNVFNEGCSSTCSATLTVNPNPICSISGNMHPERGKSTVLCAVAGMQSYKWSHGETSRCVSIGYSGMFTVTVTSTNGCTSSCMAMVVYPGDKDMTTGGNTSSDYIANSNEENENLLGDTEMNEYNNSDVFQGLNIIDKSFVTRKNEILVSAYPNPFHTKTTIQFQIFSNNAHVVIELYQLEGHKLKTLFDQNVEQRMLYYVDVLADNYPNGVYYYKITNGNSIVNRKLIIMK